MAAAYLPARERLRNHQPVQIERVQVVATVLDGRGGGEPERCARRDDLCPRTRKPRYGATRAAHRVVRQRGDLVGRLHQDHPVPAVRGHAGNGPPPPPAPTPPRPRPHGSPPRRSPAAARRRPPGPPPARWSARTWTNQRERPGTRRARPRRRGAAAEPLPPLSPAEDGAA